MEDNGNIIYYIILGAIYLLSKVFGKKKKKPASKPVQQRNVEAPTAEKDEPAPLSFEEILRELSGAKQPKPVSETFPLPDLDDSLPAPAIEAVPQPTYAVDEIDQIAVDYEVPDAIGTRAENKVIKRKKLKFERTEHFKIKEKESVDYLSLLEEEEGAAKAFVMSEIFARKY
jgi:hypothetical protein